MPQAIPLPVKDTEFRNVDCGTGYGTLSAGAPETVSPGPDSVPETSVFAPVGGMSCDPLWLRSLGGGVPCSALWRSCCRDHAGLAAGRCRGLDREGCAWSRPFGSLPLRQSPKAPPLTRITMPRPMRTMGKRMCSQRSSTSAIGGRVATNFARATRTATSARKTMQ